MVLSSSRRLSHPAATAPWVSVVIGAVAEHQAHPPRGPGSLRTLESLRAPAVGCSDGFGGVPGSLRFLFSVPSESQNHFFDLVAARVGKTLVMTGYREATFCQHPDRGDVILGSPRINGARLQVAQKLGQRLGGDAPAPILPAKPIA